MTSSVKNNFKLNKNKFNIGEKMFCSNCGFEVNDEDNFCTNCGTKIIKSENAEKQPSPIKLRITIDGKDISEYKETEEEKKKRKNIELNNDLTRLGVNIPSYSSPYDFEDEEDEE